MGIFLLIYIDPELNETNKNSRNIEFKNVC